MNVIRRYEWFIIWKPECPYSQKAEKTLKNNGYNPIVVDIRTLGEPMAVREFMNKHADGHTTVPVIFHQGRFIGGYEDLQKIINN